MGKSASIVCDCGIKHVISIEGGRLRRRKIKPARKRDDDLMAFLDPQPDLEPETEDSDLELED